MYEVPQTQPKTTEAFRPAGVVHNATPRPQGLRCKGRDYRQPAFYMITMTTHNRQRLFATCADNRSTLTHDGWLVYDLWHAMPKTYPQLRLSTLVIMPDHLHGIVRVQEQMPQSVGVPLRAFKSQVTSALRKQRDDPNFTVWNPGYHDLCVWRSGSLNAYIRYIGDNPRRYCVRQANPDVFRRINHLTHPRLPAGPDWTGYGNLFLLDRPHLVNVQVSRRASPEDVRQLCEDLVPQAANRAVIVSPFLSPGEKEVARAVLDSGTGQVIIMKPEGFPPFFKPKGRYFDLCNDGRLLILSAFPDETHPEELTREKCLAMNVWCKSIAEHEEDV